MYQLRYLDAYNVERTLEYENLDAFLLAFSGCVTVPDIYIVTALTHDGQELEFKGRIGDLYRYLKSIDPKAK